jgi:hypothetical protein
VVHGGKGHVQECSEGHRFRERGLVFVAVVEEGWNYCDIRFAPVAFTNKSSFLLHKVYLNLKYFGRDIYKFSSDNAFENYRHIQVLTLPHIVGEITCLPEKNVI